MVRSNVHSVNLIRLCVAVVLLSNSFSSCSSVTDVGDQFTCGPVECASFLIHCGRNCLRGFTPSAIKNVARRSSPRWVTLAIVHDVRESLDSVLGVSTRKLNERNDGFWPTARVGAIAWFEARTSLSASSRHCRLFAG